MTPGQVTDFLEELSAAFRERDSRALLAQFSSRPEATYAGSEADEIASGPENIKTLFEDLLSRENAYSFTFGTPHVIVTPAGSWILAEGTGTEHGPFGDTETFGYRVTGMIVIEGGRSVWLALCGSEVVPPVVPIRRPLDEHNPGQLP